MLRRALFVLALGSGATALPAQDLEIRIAPPRDTVVLQARELATAGNFPAGRQLLDSVLAANVPDGEIYAEALFWRGAIAETAAAAERDYRRLLIEAPISPRAEDALLQLAQLLHARGDRHGASEVLHRYVLTYPNDPSRPARPRVAIWLVRLLFEQNLVTRGCDAMRIGREAVMDESLELKNQLEFYAPRCAYADVAATEQQGAPGGGGGADTAKPRAAAAPPVAPRTRAAPPAAPVPRAKTYWSVQVAAYDSPEAAERMAQGLVTRGLDARVDGTKRPFRVRVGKYPTRADAVKMAQTLKAQGQNGFVTQVTVPPDGQPN